MGEFPPPRRNSLGASVTEAEEAVSLAEQRAATARDNARAAEAEARAAADKVRAAKAELASENASDKAEAANLKAAQHDPDAIKKISGTGDVPMMDPATGRIVYVSEDLAKFYGDQAIGGVGGLIVPVVKAVENAFRKKDPTAAAPGTPATPPAPTPPPIAGYDAHGNPIPAIGGIFDFKKNRAAREAREAATARAAAQAAVHQAQRQAAPQAPPPDPESTPQGEDTMANSPFTVPGGYLGAEDHVNGQSVGYDEAEIGAGEAVAADADLKGDDEDIGNLEDVIDSFGADEMGDDGMGSDDAIGALFQTERGLSRRDERIAKRAARAKRFGHTKRYERLMRRRRKIAKLHRRLLAHRRRHAARRSERHHRHMMPLRDTQAALDLIADLPVKGEIVRIPLLKAGAAAIDLSGTSTAANATTTATATTAGISYASLRFLGLLVQVATGNPETTTGALAGPSTYRITAAANDGGTQVIYGPQLDIIVPAVCTSSKTGPGAAGSGIMWVPGLRDKPLIEKLGTIKATIAQTYHTKGLKTVSFATIEAICETVVDVQVGIRNTVEVGLGDYNEPDDEDGNAGVDVRGED